MKTAVESVSEMNTIDDGDTASRGKRGVSEKQEKKRSKTLYICNPRRMQTVGILLLLNVLRIYTTAVSVVSCLLLYKYRGVYCAVEAGTGI